MMVMPANNAKMLVGYLAGKYEGRIGWLMSPRGMAQSISLVAIRI